MEYGLTHHQSISLIMVQVMKSPDLVRYFIDILKDVEKKDAYNYHTKGLRGAGWERTSWVVEKQIYKENILSLSIINRDYFWKYVIIEVIGKHRWETGYEWKNSKCPDIHSESYGYEEVVGTNRISNTFNKIKMFNNESKEHILKMWNNKKRDDDNVCLRFEEGCQLIKGELILEWYLANVF